MVLTTEKKIILFVLILTVLAAAIIGGVIFPTVTDIYHTKDSLHKIRVYLEQNYERTKHMRATKEKVIEIRTDVLAQAPYLFKRGEELKLITQLEANALKNRVNQKIENSNLDDQKNNKIIINLDASGQYNSLFSYLRDIEAMDYFINVERLQFGPLFEGGNETPSNYNLSLKLGMYVE